MKRRFWLTLIALLIAIPRLHAQEIKYYNGDQFIALCGVEQVDLLIGGCSGYLAGMLDLLGSTASDAICIPKMPLPQVKTMVLSNLTARRSDHSASAAFLIVQILADLYPCRRR